MKKFVAGLIIGAGLSFAFGANAEVASLVGKVIQSEVDVNVNGVPLESKGAIIDGITQAPVREIAESLGMEVNFDASSGVSLTGALMVVGEGEENVVESTKPGYEGSSRMPSKEELEDMIKSLESLIDGAKYMIERNPNMKPETLEKLKQDIEQNESEKAELEAQLEALE